MYRDGTNEILSGTVTGSANARGYQGATKRKTDTYQFAVGGRYGAGPLTITADLARTSSKFKLSTESVDFYINRTDYVINWFTGVPGGSGPTSAGSTSTSYSGWSCSADSDCAARGTR